MAWSPDGKTIAVASSIGIWLYLAKNLNAEPRLLQGDTDIGDSITFSPDSTQLASAINYNTVRVWDVRTGQISTTLQSPSFISSVAFQPGWDTTSLWL